MSRKIFITSDWHFNHEAIHDFEGRERGYEKELIRKINNQVWKDDILINLGDVIFSKSSELSGYTGKIHCKNIILVRWNHDKGTYDFYLNHWFQFVCDEFKLRWQQQPIIFSHIPVENLPEGYINIHWHLHSWAYREWIDDGNHILYNPEKSGSNFVPILLKNIISKHKLWNDKKRLHEWKLSMTQEEPTLSTVVCEKLKSLCKMVIEQWKYLFENKK